MSRRCCRRGAGAGLALVALGWLAGCSRSEPPAARVAVLRFENLTGDASLDWMGRALSELVGAAATGTPRRWVIPYSTLRTWGRALGPRPAAAPGISGERSQALLAGANRLVQGEYSIAGGKLWVAAVVEDAASGKTVEWAEAAGAGPEDVLGAAAALAAGLGMTGQPPATANPEALRYYAEGLEAPERAAAVRSVGTARGVPVAMRSASRMPMVTVVATASPLRVAGRSPWDAARLTSVMRASARR